MAIVSNIFIDQGANFEIDVTVSNGDGGVLDLTGYTAVAQLRKTYESSTYIDFSTIIVGDPVNGVITIALTGEQTAALEYGRYVYDMMITSESNIKTRVIEGIATVTPGVTRSP